MHGTQRGSARARGGGLGGKPLSRAQGALPSKGAAAEGAELGHGGQEGGGGDRPDAGIEHSTSVRLRKPGSASMAASSSLSRTLTQRSMNWCCKRQ